MPPADVTPARPPGPGARPLPSGLSTEDAVPPPPQATHPAPFTAIPSAVLVHQAALGLSPQQVCLIAQLCSFQWDRRLPYPSVATLARRMGCSRAQVQRYLRELAQAGLLVVHPRRRPDGATTSNAYDLSPLWERAQALAAAAAAAVPPPAPRACEHTPARPGAGPPRAGAIPPLTPARPQTPESNQHEANHQAAPSQHRAALPTIPAAPGHALPHTGGGAPDRLAVQDPRAPGSAAPPGGEDLLQALVARGVTARTAQLLVRACPPERIRQQLAHLDSLPRPPRNPAGWLVSAIRHNYINAAAAGPGWQGQAAAPVPGWSAVSGAPAGAPAVLPDPPQHGRGGGSVRCEQLATQAGARSGAAAGGRPAEQEPERAAVAVPRRVEQELAALEEMRRCLGLGPWSAAERAQRAARAQAYYAALAAPQAAGAGCGAGPGSAGPGQRPGEPPWAPPRPGEGAPHGAGAAALPAAGHPHGSTRASWPAASARPASRAGPLPVGSVLQHAGVLRPG